MLEALSAEWLKFRRHRSTWFLVWLFPIGVVLLSIIGMLVELGRGLPPGGPESAADWVEGAAYFWNVPGNGVTRLLIAAFTAVVFAGEYGWNTWKLIVPHRSRTSLIAAKYLAVVLMLYAAFIAAAVLMTGLQWVRDLVTGDTIPDGITFAALAGAHLQGFVASLPAVLLTIAYTSLFAILTGSTTAAIVIGVVITILEGMFRTFAPLLAITFGSLIETVYQALPGYHAANLAVWIHDGRAISMTFPSGGVIAHDWTTSLAVLALWIVGLVALTFVRFRRQDLN